MKFRADELCFPIHQLICVIGRDGVWPAIWKKHWEVPIYKRKAGFDPCNYRGVHMTPQLSKCVERALHPGIFSELVAFGGYGEWQFAYDFGKGSRDALGLVITIRVRKLSFGNKIGVMSSDASGAFDNVPADRLVARMEARGAHESVLRLIITWLEERHAEVVVAGQTSIERPLRDMVFQGIVWGPPLCNIYYCDVRVPICIVGYQESKNADYVNSFKVFDRAVEDSVILAANAECQAGIHGRGKANVVQFDATKEHSLIIHRRSDSDEEMKMLGCIVDCRLTMQKNASTRLRVRCDGVRKPSEEPGDSIQFVIPLICTRLVFCLTLNRNGHLSCQCHSIVRDGCCAGLVSQGVECF